MTRRLYDQWDPSFVSAALADVSRASLWSNLEKLAGWKRESGSADEWAAARFVAAQLAEWGVAPTVLEPELYLSSPKRARLTVLGPEPFDIVCKAAAFSAATAGLEGELAYVPYEKDRQKDAGASRGPDVRGKIVLTEKLFMPPKVLAHQRAGAIGQIYAKPAEILHEQGASPVWGNPTPRTSDQLPNAPVLSIKKSDGEKLARLCGQGPVRVRIEADVDSGWYRCPLVVGEISPPGGSDRFLMVHAHLDSWHYGVGDNATGDATVMEIARVFQKHRDQLKHRLRIAFWPGHFKGHYAGSAWYADTYAADLSDNCFAHIDIDSPGCRWATDFSEHVVWMKEAETFVRDSIQQITGQHAPGARPLRAGDFSFNQLGVTGLMKMLSNIPADVRREKGFGYFVGGCGGNPVWHTEDDTLATADPDNLERDARIYVHAVARLLTSTVHPLDYTMTAAEMEGFLRDYQAEAGGHFDLAPALAAAGELREALERVYARVEEVLGQPPSAARDRLAAALNDGLLAVSRLIVPVDYAAGERFDHDLGVPLWPLPRLAGIKKLNKAAKNEHFYRSLKTMLVREQNTVVHALREATRITRGMCP